MAHKWKTKTEGRRRRRCEKIFENPILAEILTIFRRHFEKTLWKFKENVERKSSEAVFFMGVWRRTRVVTETFGIFWRNRKFWGQLSKIENFEINKIKNFINSLGTLQALVLIKLK